jgi:hypothetical protein
MRVRREFCLQNKEKMTPEEIKFVIEIESWLESRYPGPTPKQATYLYRIADRCGWGES